VSDVVKGLREAASGKGGLDYGDLWAYCDEAADEIERLEAELAAERARADKATAQYEALASTMGWLDRLPLVDRALNAEADCDRLRTERAKLYLEQERLREKLARSRLDAFQEKIHAARGET